MNQVAMNEHQTSTKKRQSPSPRRLAVAIALLGLGPMSWFSNSLAAEAEAARKKPKPVACSAIITKCGCTITTTGFYQVQQKLGAPGSLNELDNSCIAVSAPRVVLYLDGMSIINKITSGGIGIHLNSSAINSYIEGAGATIAGWSFGVEDNASNSIITNLSADNNDTAGVLVQQVTGVSISNVGSHNNGSYGIWLNGATFSQVGGGIIGPTASGIQNNGLAGIQVSTLSKPAAPSNNVRIFGNCVTGNGGAGIALQPGVTNTAVSGNEVTGNSGGDLADSNNNCGSNLWFGNAFGTGNPTTCVGQTVMLNVCSN